MNVIEITDETFDSLVNDASKVIVLDFTAQWCGPCKMMSPVVEVIAKQFDGKALVGKLDIDDNPNTAARFGVRNFPTFLFFKGGKVMDKVIGAVPKSMLEQKVNALL
jgi:thioredoxin 1